MNPAEPKYLVPKSKLENLIIADKVIKNLEAAGVDNWEGFEYAFNDECYNSDTCEWDVSKELEKFTKLES